MAADEIIGVFAMGHSGMTAGRAVRVIPGVLFAAVAGRAGGWIGVVHTERMFVHMAAVDMMEMAIVQIVGVPVVNDCGVTTTGLMLVSVSLFMGPMALATEAGKRDHRGESEGFFHGSTLFRFDCDFRNSARSGKRRFCK